MEKKLKIKRTVGYGTYSDKELKQYLKEQAQMTYEQISAEDTRLKEEKQKLLEAGRELLDNLGNPMQIPAYELVVKLSEAIQFAEEKKVWLKD
jgi:hypothetical protein